MDPLILYPTLVIGFVLVCCHLFLCHRRKESVNLALLTNAVLAASGLVCGVLLLVGSFFKPVMNHLTGINVYIFIAGLAVCYVSVTTIYKDFSIGKKKEAAKNEPSPSEIIGSSRLEK